MKIGHSGPCAFTQQCISITMAMAKREQTIQAFLGFLTLRSIADFISLKESTTPVTAKLRDWILSSLAQRTLVILKSCELKKIANISAKIPSPYQPHQPISSSRQRLCLKPPPSRSEQRWHNSAQAFQNKVKGSSRKETELVFALRDWQARDFLLQLGPLVDEIFRLL